VGRRVFDMTRNALTATDRCMVLGVVNVTPDSFSDGGRFLATGAAVERGRYLVQTGADIVDVGGESTRPGAVRTSSSDETNRVLPVIEQLASAGIAVSVDTMRASVAQRALEAGAVMVNDVSGGRADPRILEVVAEARVPYVLTHWRAHSSVMHAASSYSDVVAEVLEEIARQLARAQAAGIDQDRIVIDPGLGFSKSPESNWAILRSLGMFVATGHRVLVGASRKRFLAELTGTGREGESPSLEALDAATTAVTTLAAHHGAWGVRVHDACAAAAAVRVTARWATTPGRVVAPR
jgi:dihydropteroate synthase